MAVRYAEKLRKVKIDHQRWQQTFTLNRVPMCPKGMQLAETFLAVCVHGVDHAADIDHGNLIMASWRIVSEHAKDCGNCHQL